MSRVLILAGGTGGHVFPALATARLLRERGCEVSWVGTRRGLEARVVPADGFPIEWLVVAGLRGKGWSSWLLAPLRLLRALAQALAIVRRRAPAAVLGVGGFVTGPGGVAAWLLRRPLVIHEQNAVAGMTNRLLAPLTREVLEAFPGSFPPGVGARCVGNPVRREIATLAPPDERFAARSGPVRLLVVGGSLGAARLNSAVPGALKRLTGRLALEVWHQTGERGQAEAVQFYAAQSLTHTSAPPRAARAPAHENVREATDPGTAGAAPASITLAPFIEDMAQAYGWADLVLCRAGALTISELAAAGLGAVLVPFPAAVDDHQTRNAAYLVEAGAAVLIPDGELEPERLARTLSELCADRARLLDMACRARARAKPDAAEQLTRAVLDAAGGRA